MSDWIECPNECGRDVRADWIRPNNPDWAGAYKIPRSGDYHLRYECQGSFSSGAAVAFGLMGMAEEIRARSWACPSCGADRTPETTPSFCAGCGNW